MAKTKAAKRTVTRKSTRPAAQSVGRAKTPASRPASGGKAAAAPSRRGLIVFAAIVAAVVLFGVVGKLRQGPPVKLLPVQVLGTFPIGEEGSLGLSAPRGIAVDAAGAVYIADLGNDRVVKLNPDGSLAGTWGKPGEGNGQFKEPSGVAVDAAGSVFVADAWNGRIQKFTAAGEYLGEIGAKSGNFYSPRNVAADDQGFIYVADTGNSCVKKFDADATLVKKWGEFGPGKDRFQETFGLWVGQDRTVYIGDAGNRRIKITTADGKYLREIRVKGWRQGASWPMVAADASGRVYASDAQNQMIWIYDREGKYLGSWGNQPNRDLFSAPLGLAVGPDGNVYVCNMNRGQVLKLAPPQR